MIIYGTGSFNRREHSVVRDACPSCSRVGYLNSYTCSRFFTLYFIPLIPLGKYKITLECPHCKQALGMPYRKWSKLRQTDLAKAIANYEAKPADETAATEALGAIAGLQSRTTLLRVGPQIRRAFARNATMLARLADAYSHLCLDKEADDVYLEAVSHSADEQISAKADAHVEAQKLARPRPPNRLLQSVPVLIVPAILLLALAGYLQKAAAPGVEEGYLLSGLDHPYSVVVNGEKITLRPKQRVRAGMLVFGKNEIESTPESPFIPRQTFEVDVPWYRRPFANPVVVVNPDRAAVMLWERTGYAYPKPPENTYHYEVSAGQSHYVYQDVDFIFRVFPDTVETPSNGTVVYRTRVSEMREAEPDAVARLLLTTENMDGLQGYLRAKLRSEEYNERAIFIGSRFLPRDEFLSLARARLNVRPLQIQWHRAYQNLLEHTPEGENLEAEYREWVRREPAESSLTYLLGRVTSDLDERREVFERARTMPNPTAYAAYALAYFHLLEGDFSQALACSDEALRLEPDNTSFRHGRENARYGAGDYAAIENEVGDLLKTTSPSYPAFHDHVYRLAKLGRVEQAKTEMQEFMRHLAQQAPLSEADRNDGIAYLESALSLAAMDKKAFASAAARIGGETWAFRKAVAADDLDSALQLAEAASAAMGILDRLTLYILLSRASRTAQAEVQLAQAVAAMSAGGGSLSRWAGWLGGEGAPDVRVAAHACEDPEHHFLYLLALAQKYPDRAGEYRARAAAIRYKDSFYSLTVSPSSQPEKRELAESL